MSNEFAVVILNRNKISIEGNGFIKKIKLSENYWSTTLSLDEVEIVNNQIEDINDSNKNNLYFFKEDLTNSNEPIPNFLRPRPDWNIKNGDYIVKENREIKKKLFTKKDIKNIQGAFWYISLSAFLTYYILQAITKIT